MAGGHMYNIGVNFLAKNGVSPSLIKIATDTKRTSAEMLGLGTQIRRTLGNLPGILRPFSAGGGLIGAMLGTASVYGAVSGIRSMIGAMTEFEAASYQFDKLIGNAKLAKQSIADLAAFAATTPFEFRQSHQMAIGLLGANVAAKDLVGTMRMLGDLGLGDPENIQRMVHAYIRARSLNKVTWLSISPFATSGVPIVDALAKSIGVAKEEIQKLSRAGKITFEDLDKSLRSLASTSKYSGMMQGALTTLKGLRSNLPDALYFMKIALGEGIQEPLKLLLQQATLLAFRIRDWATANKELIASSIGKFLEGVALAISKIDPDKLFKTAAAVGSFLKWAVVGIVAFKTFSTVLGLMAVAMQFAGGAAVLFGVKAAIGLWPVVLILLAVASAVGLVMYAMHKLGKLQLGDWENRLGTVTENARGILEGFGSTGLPTRGVNGSEPVSIQGQSAVRSGRDMSYINSSETRNQNVAIYVDPNVPIRTSGDLPSGMLRQLNLASALNS